MNILRMSFTATVFIVVTVILRWIALNRLPKRTFVMLWIIAALKMLTPVSIPFRFSVYALVNQPVETPAIPMKALTGMVGLHEFATETRLVREAMAQPAAEIPLWRMIWIAGALALATAMVFMHLRSRRVYAAALPASIPAVTEWMDRHRLRRKVRILCSDQVAAPMTYGLIRPVILLPSRVNWHDRQRVACVLDHEWMHIRRMDVAVKWLLAAAVCLHWFNPAAWLMYRMANLDMELACDEGVLRRSGMRSSAYARALVDLEAQKAGLISPFSSGFSRKTIQERIRAIMKMKHGFTRIAACLAVLLVICVAAGFATGAPKRKIAEASNDYSLKTLGYTDHEAQMLGSLRLKGYQEMSVREFRDRINNIIDEPAWMNLYERVCQDEAMVDLAKGDALADYLANTLGSLAAERWQSRQTGGCAQSETAYDWQDRAMVEYVLTRTILDDKRLTVGAYEKAMEGMENGLSSILCGYGETELASEETMNAVLEQAIEALKERWSSPYLTFDVEYIYQPLTPSDNNIEAYGDENTLELLAMYAGFGLEYDSELARRGVLEMRYEGKTVRGIRDDREGIVLSESMGKGRYGDDAVELYVTYDDAGRPNGLRTASNEEAAWISEQREASSARAAMPELEPREQPGTAEDYKSLMDAVFTPDYARQSLLDFDTALLEWANRDGNEAEVGAMDRIVMDAALRDFRVPLSEAEKEFVTLTVQASALENAKRVLSNYTGQERQNVRWPGFTLIKDENSMYRSAWCSAYCEISYLVADESAVTVGERDSRLKELLVMVNQAWNDESLDDMMALGAEGVASMMNDFAENATDDRIQFKINVGFEAADERF